MIQSFFSDADLWRYVSIPFVAAFVGWSTNWVAVKMLFFPVRPLGKPPWLGWQGIIPMKARKMGAITADTTLSKLGSVEDIFAALEPDRIASHLVASIRPRVEAYVDEVMMAENPALWEALPGLVKQMVYRLVRDSIERTVQEMMDDIQEHVGEMVDLKEAVVQRLGEKPVIANRIFQECGAREFRFIVRSGWYFGFAFGLIQMVTWLLYPAMWILPVFGAMVGYATNWIALRIIFQPLHPRRVGPFLLQGLFLQRQHEVSVIWCDIVTHDVLTVPGLMNALLFGPHSRRSQALIRNHIRRVVDDAFGIARPLVEFTVGVERLMQIKETATDRVIELTAGAFDDPAFNEEEARRVKQMLETRMQALSPEEFQNLLRPAFQEEEIKLILIGAFLGTLAGLAQLFLVFGG